MTIFFMPEMATSARNAEIANKQTSLINERLQTIDMKYRDESEILAELMKITNGQEVKANADDEALLQDSEQQLHQAEQDKIRSKLEYDAKIQEKRILEQARQAAGEIRR